MTEISAKIIKDSISIEGIRLTTMHLRYPRFIHAELMTHRDFSRNARSSRAVPIKTMIKECIDDPVIPIFWGKNQKGMQASEECAEKVLIEEFIDGEVGFKRLDLHVDNTDAWLKARDMAVMIATSFMDAGYHKQVVNRLLEPFLHIDVLVSSTNWANWFALRDHNDAEPHIQVLAREMRKAMDASKPNELMHNMWHLPFVNSDEIDEWEQYGIKTNDAIKVSVARCARISYKPFDGDDSLDAELRRYDMLVGSSPVHASPAEHQAVPDVCEGTFVFNGETFRAWSQPDLHGNFRGWAQYRKMLPNERVKDAA